MKLTPLHPRFREHFMKNFGRKERRSTVTALSFLAPNILGVLVFVVFPVLFAIMLAFTNWDLRLHNQYKDAPLEFVGLANFIRLFSEGDFVRFLGNTLFLMMGIPFSVAGSLFAAIMLSKDTRGGGGKVNLYLIASGVMIVSCILLAVVGMGATAMTILLVSVAGGVAIMGLFGGVTVYRTLFYTPHFTAGIATFLLWKQLYNPEIGPINQALRPALEALAATVNSVPAPVVAGLRWVGVAIIAAVIWGMFSKLGRSWRDGDLGTKAAILPVVFVLLPVVVGLIWDPMQMESVVLLTLVAAAVAYHSYNLLSGGRDLSPPSENEGFGNALMLSLGAMTLSFVVLGLSAVVQGLPSMASEGPLEAPKWLTDPGWAKPALMIMGFWGAFGGNNMLLYLAALTNVPQELYEAADIDGAKPMQRFWNVTWPQLAPTTFFVCVMATIYGLQGGFEMARVMTQGGPDGATTTLSYFVYREGFETGRLSYAAATAWALFIIVFTLTMFNWRFGNKYTND
jgi:multiple sugar transport system permease protein